MSYLNSNMKLLDLVIGAQNGNEACWNELFRKFSPLLKKGGIMHIQSEQLSKTEKQLLKYIKVHVYGKSLRFKNDYMNIKKNECLILNQSCSYQKEQNIDYISHPNTSSFENILILKITLEQEMKRLDPRAQLIIKKYFWENRNIQQIAEELGISKNTVLRVKKAALEELRKFL